MMLPLLVRFEFDGKAMKVSHGALTMIGILCYPAGAPPDLYSASFSVTRYFRSSTSSDSALIIPSSSSNAYPSADAPVPREFLNRGSYSYSGQEL